MYYTTHKCCFKVSIHIALHTVYKNFSTTKFVLLPFAYGPKKCHGGVKFTHSQNKVLLKYT